MISSNDTYQYQYPRLAVSKLFWLVHLSLLHDYMIKLYDFLATNGIFLKWHTSSQHHLPPSPAPKVSCFETSCRRTTASSQDVTFSQADMVTLKVTTSGLGISWHHEVQEFWCEIDVRRGPTSTLGDFEDETSVVFETISSNLPIGPTSANKNGDGL